MYQKPCRLTIADKFYGSGGAPEAVTRNISEEWPQIKQLQQGQEFQYGRFHKEGKPGSDPILSAAYGLATDYLTPGGQFNIEMTPEEIRDQQQKVLGLFASKGTLAGGLSPQAIAADVLNRDAYQRGKLMEAVGLGESVFNTGVQGYTALTNPLLAYASQLFDYNANAENAANIAASNKSNSTLGGVASLTGQVVGSAAKAYTGGISDERLKEDIKSTGEKTPEGIPIKEFSYKGDERRFRGVVAQDVEKVKPEAVITMPVTGFKMVDFAKISPIFEEIKET